MYIGQTLKYAFEKPDFGLKEVQRSGFRGSGLGGSEVEGLGVRRLRG